MYDRLDLRLFVVETNTSDPHEMGKPQYVAKYIVDKPYANIPQ